MDYYVFADKASSEACITAINSAAWFPVVGRRNGVESPESQATTKWCDTPLELVSGEWAVPRIPADRLDYAGVPQEDRDAFMAAFGQDTRALSREDIVVIAYTE